MIQDVRTLSKKVAQGTTLGCNEAMQFDWPLVAYCSREGNLSLEGNVLHKYYLLDGKESVTEEMKVRYVNVVLPLRRYTLMERIDTIEIQK